MADEKVGLLMSVDLDVADTLKTIAQLRQETAQLRAEQKALDTSTEEGRIEYERYNAQIKANTKTIQQYEKEVQNSIKQDVEKEGSIKSLRAQLSNAKAAYAELSKTERDGAKGRELLDKTASLNAELKELESAYGDNHRKIGEYENAGRSLKTELRELTDQLAMLAVNGQKDSEIYAELAQKASILKDAQADVNAQITQMASDTVAFDTMLQGAQAVTAAYGVWKSAAAALGIENEALEDTMKRFMVVMQALQSLQTLQNLAQKQSNIYRAAANILQKIGIRQTTQETVANIANTASIKAESIAENASTAAKTKGVIATKLATSAQWLWNAAMAANPVLLIVIAVAALIAGITALVSWLSKESNAAKDAATAQEAYNNQIEQSAAVQERLTIKTNAAINNRQLAARQEIAELKANGATKQQIADAEAKAAKDVRDIEIAAAKDREKAARANLAAARELEAAQIKARDELKVGSKKWNEYNDAIKETNASIRDHVTAVDEAFFAQKNLVQDQIEADAKAVEDQKKAAKEAVDASINKYSKLIDEQRKFNEESLKAESGYLSTNLKTQQDYARKIFNLNQDAEKAKLDNLRKYNRITEDEYNRSLGVMTSQLTAFTNKQVSDLNKFFESERNVILGMLSKSLDEQIADTEKKYTDAIKRLSLIEPPDPTGFATQEDYDKAYAEYEAFMLEQANIAIRLEQQKNDEIAKLQESSLAKRIKEIEDAAKLEYSDDLVLYQNNERKKLEINEKRLKAQIAAKRKEFGDEADITAELIELDNIRFQRVQLNLNAELILAGNNANKRYEARKKALDAELAAAQGNADAILEINQRIADNEAELLEARFNAAAEWIGRTMGLLNGLNDLFNAQSDARLQKIQEQYDSEQAKLEEKYNKGLLTEEQYNQKSLELEKKKEKEEAKIARQQAIREKSMKVFNIVTDTAMGIVRTAAATPTPWNIPLIAMMSAIGAVNLASVIAEPLPKAARGGVVGGRLHSGGGTIIEAERGEGIVNRKSMQMFGPIVSAINELGGGVPFATPYSDGGYVARHIQTKGVTVDDLTAAIGNLKIYTFVDDINRGQQQFAEMESRGTM